VIKVLRNQAEKLKLSFSTFPFIEKFSTSSQTKSPNNEVPQTDFKTTLFRIKNVTI